MPRYYYTHDRRRFGPVDASQLRHAGTTGELIATDYVLAEGDARWERASKFRGLLPEERPASTTEASPAGAKAKLLAACSLAGREGLSCLREAGGLLWRFGQYGVAVWQAWSARRALRQIEPTLKEFGVTHYQQGSGDAALRARIAELNARIAGPLADRDRKSRERDRDELYLALARTLETTPEELRRDVQRLEQSAATAEKTRAEKRDGVFPKAMPDRLRAVAGVTIPLLLLVGFVWTAGGQPKTRTEPGTEGAASDPAKPGTGGGLGGHSNSGGGSPGDSSGDEIGGKGEKTGDGPNPDGGDPGDKAALVVPEDPAERKEQDARKAFEAERDALRKLVLEAKAGGDRRKKASAELKERYPKLHAHVMTLVIGDESLAERTHACNVIGSAGRSAAGLASLLYDTFASGGGPSDSAMCALVAVAPEDPLAAKSLLQASARAGSSPFSRQMALDRLPIVAAANPAARKEIVDRLKDAIGTSDPAVVAAASGAMRVIVRTCPEVRPSFVALVQPALKSPAADSRLEAMSFLTACGDAAAPALKDLEGMEFDKARAVREALPAAIKEIERRVKFAPVLAKAGIVEGEVTPELYEALFALVAGDGDAALKKAPTEKAAIKGLAGLARLPDKAIKTAAVEALGNWADGDYPARAGNALAGLLDDPVIAPSVLARLSTLGRNHAGTRRIAASSVVAALKEQALADSAVDTLQHWGKVDLPLALQTLPALADACKGGLVGEKAAGALGQLARLHPRLRPHAVTALAEALVVPGVTDAACDALAYCGPEAVRHLRKLEAGPASPMQKAARDALQEERLPRRLCDVLCRTREETPVRQSAGEALAEFKVLPPCWIQDLLSVHQKEKALRAVTTKLLITGGAEMFQHARKIYVKEGSNAELDAFLKGMGLDPTSEFAFAVSLILHPKVEAEGFRWALQVHDTHFKNRSAYADDSRPVHLDLLKKQLGTNAEVEKLAERIWELARKHCKPGLFSNVTPAQHERDLKWTLLTQFGPRVPKEIIKSVCAQAAEATPGYTRDIQLYNLLIIGSEGGPEVKKHLEDAVNTWRLDNESLRAKARAVLKEFK